MHIVHLVEDAGAAQPNEGVVTSHKAHNNWLLSGEYSCRTNRGVEPSPASPVLPKVPWQLQAQIPIFERWHEGAE